MTHKETLTLLSNYGWSDTLRHDFQPFAAQGLVPARVIVQPHLLVRGSCGARP